ncbi:FAD-dependent oxidoreductase [Photobacterium damselae subsp. piscicida]|nr:FAD-dependent oxidoreductase [Photobacterium damselae subsp. piscicida]MDP2557902.1 FAD-dependent oxidoreductase [Photobacterium damselae subsp. piscicida]
MKIIIIGGEAAGMSAAAKAKRIEPNAEIVVYEASKVISFGACGLPYFIGGEFDNAEYMAEFTPEQFATKGITVLTEHRVLSIDDKSQQLTVEHCGETFTTNYDCLMIATGAKEILPPIAGLDRQGVYSLRKMVVTPIDLLMVKFTFYKRSNNLIVHLFAFRKTNGFSY